MRARASNRSVVALIVPPDGLARTHLRLLRTVGLFHKCERLFRNDRQRSDGRHLQLRYAGEIAWKNRPRGTGGHVALQLVTIEDRWSRYGFSMLGIFGLWIFARICACACQARSTSVHSVRSSTPIAADRSVEHGSARTRWLVVKETRTNERSSRPKCVDVRVHSYTRGTRVQRVQRTALDRDTR